MKGSDLPVLIERIGPDGIEELRRLIADEIAAHERQPHDYASLARTHDGGPDDPPRARNR